MTREEAIECLNFQNEKFFGGQSEALKMAISALSENKYADIMESAREIKDYCEGFPNCEGCRFYKEFPFRCTFGICPQEWNLLEPYKAESEDKE